MSIWNWDRYCGWVRVIGRDDARRRAIAVSSLHPPPGGRLDNGHFIIDSESPMTANRAGRTERAALSRFDRLVAVDREPSFMMPASTDLRDDIRNIPDFPKPGIMFKDITPLLSNPPAFRTAIEQLEQHFEGRGIDVIAAAEARGFIFGVPLAMQMGAGFVPIRKPGKLPYATIAQEYQLEYGSDRLEVHTDALFRPPRAAARRCSGHRRNDAGLSRSRAVHWRRARRLCFRDRALVPWRPRSARAR